MACLRTGNFWRTALQRLAIRPQTASFSRSACAGTADAVTHTGQKWDKDDYRMARFVDREKQVNTKFAIDLIAEVAPKACAERIVSCDGGGGALGHPEVYINLDQPGNHTCGYCGLRFYMDGHHHHGCDGHH